MGVRLKDKVCVITGAASGLGREIALKFAEQGAVSVIFDIDEAGGMAVAKEINDNRGRALYVYCDITDETKAGQAVEKVVAEYAKIDVLVNNSGIFMEGSVTATSFADFKRIMDVNLNGSFLLMQKCLDKMLVNGGGNIINIASEAGIAAIPGQTAYNVSKAAVIMLTKSAAVDYADKNIRINCIAPGRVHTPLVQKILDEAADPVERKRELSEDRPMLRMGTPADIAMGAVYLASDESPYATGAVLSIDGGYVCP